MSQEFAVIEWRDDAESDIAIVRVADGRVQSETYPATPADLSADQAVVCFRLPEATSERRGPLCKALPADKTIDGDLVARIVFPMSDSYDLPALAGKFGLPGDATGALGRAQLAARVWIALTGRLRELPLPVLAEMERVLKPVECPLRAVIAEASDAAVKRGFGAGVRTLYELVAAMRPVQSRPERPAPADPPLPMDVAAACDLFRKEGPLAAEFKSYEYRGEQVRLVREVCDAFNDGLVLMAEAGTGTGKSLGYLVPSILWSRANHDPVIVSTNTKNLQAQLFEKDLPFLERALKGDFRYALIKGRANYLCVRKLFALLNSADAELSGEDRLGLLPLLSWLPQTVIGDVAENSGLCGGMESELWSRVSTRRDECLGPRCRWWRSCFVRRARALAMQSDVVVTNHATVFAEAGIPSVALPDYRCIIFDEAHNLENVVTDSCTLTAAPWKAQAVMSRLFRGRRDGAGRGLLTNLRFQLARAAGAVSPATAETIKQRITDALDQFTPLRGAADAWALSVGNLFGAAVRFRDDRIRYDADHRPNGWPEVAAASSEFQDEMVKLVKLLEGLRVILSECAEKRDEGFILKVHPEGEATANFEDLAAEFNAQGMQLKEAADALNKTARAEDDAYVYWAQRGRREGDVALCAAPIEIALLMQALVYDRARTVVLTSATMSVGGKFDYMLDRLGARGTVTQRLRTAELGSSFDFPRQALLAVPMFLPDPGGREGRGFVEPFCALSVALLRATHGRALALFTSHSMLREAHAKIKSALAPLGIRVLAQGVDGERAHLAALFAKDTTSVLLGTQSFWEGLDVPGESLSCLILAKLPFRVPDDPIVAARCEALEKQGRNSFAEYLVPDAAIRLKQGFGRLIRTGRDRGVVIIADSRLMTKGYGGAFRNSLPVKARVFRDEASLLDAVRRFLSAGESDPSPHFSPNK